MSTQAALAAAAIKAGDYPTAVTQLTAALATSTTNPSPLWLIERSIAHHRVGSYQLALHDAENGLLAARTRGKRDLMATAQYRRGVALHGLKRYGDARLAFNWALKLNEKEKGLTLWMLKIKNDYEKAEKEDPEGDGVKRTIKEFPEKHDGPAGEKLESSKIDTKVATSSASPAISTPQVTASEKIRTEFFQSSTNVTITLFVKGVSKEQVHVDIEEDSLSVTFPTSTSTYDYSLDPLFQKIVPSKSSFRVTPHKIEVNLAKSLAGVKWASLEGTERPKPLAQPETGVDVAKENIQHQDKAPVNPYSSKNGPKDWEKLEDEGEDENNSIDHFFQKLYKDSDPDTRRAMMKSYQESNGTALSTNWSDVGSKKTETHPPEGVEAKPW